MALQAQRSQVVEIALSPALCDRLNVIGIPQAFPAVSLQSPIFQQGASGIPARSTKPAIGCDGINAAFGAIPVIAQKDLFP